MTRRARRADSDAADPIAATPSSPDDSAGAPNPSPALAGSRAALIGVGALLVGTLVTVVGGPAAGGVIAGWLGDGVPLVAWVLAGWAIGIAFVRDRGDADDATLRHLTAVAIGLGAIGLLVFGLGWAGWLSRPVAWAIVAGGAVAGVARLRARTAALNDWLTAPAGGAWLALASVPPIAIAAVAARVVPGFLWGDEPSGYDVASYHLQLPREWFELGRIVPLRHNVFSFFPLLVEMHALLAMHLRGVAHAPGMYLAQMMCGTFALLVPLTCYAIVRPIAGRWSAAAAATVAAAAPWTTMLGGIAYDEGGLMLFATLAAAWALRGRWALAGACAGFAAGCKYTGATSAILIVPLATVFCGMGYQPMIERTRSVRHGLVARATRIALFLGVALLVLSPWLIRNAIYARGNPVFPLALHTFGPGHFDAGQVERFQIAHAPRDDQHSLGARFAALWQQVGGDWRYGSAGVVPCLFAIAIVAFGLRPKDRASHVWLGLIVANALVWLFATHLQGRFLVQAIPCVAILATVAPRFGRAQAIATVALAFVAGAIAHREPLARLAPLTRLGAIDVADLRDSIWDDDVRRAIDDAARPVVIVGDVRPFLLPIDSSRLHYRTVFDLPSGATFHDAWVGPDVPDDAWAILTPGEVERLAKTYRHVPALPARWRGVGGTFVVTAGELRRE